VAKVKKRAVVTGVRNVKASKTADRNSPAKSSAGKNGGRKKVVTRKVATKKVGKLRVAAKKSKTKAGSMSRVKARSNAGAKARLVPPAPVVRVAVKPLEPRAKCGAGTSVQSLFRVDETVDGRTTTHLVFFDRHGWYCEHGRNCPAVGHAKKYRGHMARAS
jgi:hypothetical protein